MLAAWARKRGRGAWSERPLRTNGTPRDGQPSDEADPDGDDGREGGPEGDDGDAEMEAAFKVARYWEAHPERLAEALRWPHENGGS